VQTTVEETDKHIVRMSVEVEADEVARDLDRAYRKVAGEVKIPGFRKGKVPRQIIDARIGREHVLEEFVKDSIPSYYVRAIRENGLAPISEPEIDLDQVEEGKPLKFTATVEIRPRITLRPDQYRGIHVQAPTTEPSEEEVDSFIDRLRERFAELDVVERPARKGDYALADVRAHIHDRQIAEATRLGFLSEVGSEELVPELDRELEGKRKGDILKFNAVLPEKFGPGLAGAEVTFQVLVKEVKAKKLPDRDDEFAKIASEFDTIAELREDIRTKVRELKQGESQAAVRDLVLQQIVDSVEVDLPERLVDEESERRVRSATERAERAGVSMEEVLAAQGWDELRLRSDARAHAIRALKADLVLEAVARQEELTVSEEDLQKEIRGLAEATGKDVREVARILERSGEVRSLAGDIIRTKALDLLVESADVATEDVSGSPEPDLPPTQEDSDE
jgi:trigger factor